MQHNNITTVGPRGLRQDVLDKIVGDPVLQGYIAVAIGRSSSTVLRLAKDKHLSLTQVSSLDVISKYLKIEDINDLVTESSSKQKVA